MTQTDIATAPAPSARRTASKAQNSVTVIENNQPVERNEFDKILALVENPAVDMARIEQAINLLKRVDDERARRAYERAFAAAKAEFDPIVKTHVVSYAGKDGRPPTNYKHEDLADIEKAIGPALANHGLSYRWQTSALIGQPIKATCIITHEDGWFTETTLEAGRDDTGGKNPIQSIASSLTYLQRYTLRAAAGLTIGRDDDGQSSSPRNEKPQPVISDEQIIELQKLIADTKTDIHEFLAIGNLECLSEMRASDFTGAKTILTKRQKAQQEKLGKGRS